MKFNIIYGSKTGNSWKVAHRIGEALNCTKISNAKDLLISCANIGDVFIKNDINILIASTWGDGELQEDMERFLITPSELTDLKFMIIELGNYYGYDDFSFGAGKIMANIVNAKGGEVIDMISVDSLPIIDWETVHIWLSYWEANEFK